MTVAIIGASRGIGRLLFEKLSKENVHVTGFARDRKNITTSKHAKFVELDAKDTSFLFKELEGIKTLVHCSKPAILTEALKVNSQFKRLIAIGSTRIFTRFPNEKAVDLKSMVKQVWSSDVEATIIHPTMIYGAPGSDNIERIVRLSSLSPIIPFPRAGNSLIQPVSAHDLLDGILACMKNEETVGKTIIAPGGKAIHYKEFIEICSSQFGKKTKVVFFPVNLVKIIASLTQHLPIIPTIESDELLRLFENKDFVSDDFRKLIGRKPLDFYEGINRLKKAN